VKVWLSKLSWAEVACLLHALFASAIWFLVFTFDVNVMRGRVWMPIALTWLLWLLALVLSERERRKRWMVTIAIGVVLLIPAMPTLYTYVVWTVDGFAP